MVKLNILLDKLENKIKDLEKNNDIEQAITLYKKGKKIVDKCEKKIQKIEDILDDEEMVLTEQSQDEVNLEHIIKRMTEISDELSNQNISIEESMTLFFESKVLEKKFKDFVEQNQFIEYQ